MCGQNISNLSFRHTLQEIEREREGVREGDSVAPGNARLRPSLSNGRGLGTVRCAERKKQRKKERKKKGEREGGDCEHFDVDRSLDVLIPFSKPP